MPIFDLPHDELVDYLPEIDEPADFDEFWRLTLREAREKATEVHFSPVRTALRAVEIYDVTFSGYVGDPIKAWLIKPTAIHNPIPAVVEFIGYTGGRGLPHERLAWANAGYAHLIMDNRGQGAAWAVGVTPDPHGSGAAVPGFLTRGITDPHDYYYRRLYTDAVRAVDTAKEIPDIDPSRIVVAGTSQGGGVALAAAGLVEGLTAALIDVPFLSHVRRAVAVTDHGAYPELTQYLKANPHAERTVFRTLSYMDGMNFAARATAPALFSVGLRDTVCPPSTVYAAFNRYSGRKHIDVYPYAEREGGHAYRWLEHVRFLETPRRRQEQDDEM